MTAFNVGDIVEVNIGAQSLWRGQRYEVVGVEEKATPFGNVVTYIVVHVDGGTPLRAINLPMLAEKVNP